MFPNAKWLTTELPQEQSTIHPSEIFKEFEETEGAKGEDPLLLNPSQTFYTAFFSIILLYCSNRQDMKLI